MSRVVAKDIAKIDFSKDVQVQNAPSPAGCITLLQSGNVVSALSWEPAISNAIAAQPALRSIFNLGAAYRSVNKGVLPYFSVAVRTDTLKKYPGIAERIAGVFSDTIAYINHVPTIAFNNAAPKTGLATSVMMTGFNNDRLKFATYAMSTPAGQKIVASAYEYLRAHGVYDKPLSPDFFA
jgi:ABC-type nitrate/sulfonate/bicarbonate transport system substrate-binding protein